MGKNASTAIVGERLMKVTLMSTARPGSGRDLSCPLKEYFHVGRGDLFHFKGEKPAVIPKRSTIAMSRESNLRSVKDIIPGNASNVTFLKKITLKKKKSR